MQPQFISAFLFAFGLNIILPHSVLFAQTIAPPERTIEVEQIKITEVELIFRTMFDRCNGIKTMRYNIAKQERFDGKMFAKLAEVKLSRKPYKMYMKQLEPKEGLEILYKEGENNNQVLINPAGFPWINVNLDPDGSWVRNEQHHTVRDGGYDKVIGVVRVNVRKIQ
ncbi:MAG: DUF1571 domain-containing protein [Bacteroidetes bacterium]|nr:DUF1571 domain-containing protein [Bacteroidota bacterium]